MLSAFSVDSPYKNRARTAAILWTLLILFLCFIPSSAIPKVQVPLADKWAHFILFGVFSLLWLLAYPYPRIKNLILWTLISMGFGWMVEEIQGLLTILGRSKDVYDIYADAIGGMIGVGVFYFFYRIKQG